MPPKIALSTLALSALLAFPACHAGSGSRNFHQTVEKTVPLNPGGRFRVENINGAIRIDAWDRDEVQIVAEKSASSEAALGEIEVEIQGAGDQVNVHTRLPRSNWLFGGEGGSVSYEIIAPEGARVTAITVNGQVRIEGMAGAVDAKSVNGKIEIIDAAGNVESSTVNGGIDVSYIALPDTASHGMTTVNGAVSIVLPDSAAGHFEVNTVNGGISSDFPLEISKKAFGNFRSVSDSIGEGGGSFKIKTVNGQVKIRKRTPAGI
jgi:hypothetical protein